MKFGNVDISKAYIGDTAVSKIYLGSDLVYSGARLPSEYQEVEYLESSGVQWIDTGLKGNQNTKIELDFQIIGSIENALVFGSRTSATENNIECFISSLNNRIIIDFQNYSNNRLYVDNSAVGRAKIYINNQYLKINNTQQAITTYTNFETPSNLLLFNVNGNTLYNLASMKLYSFKLYDNTTLVRNLIPCYRKSDSVAGMYDLVNDVFYVNQGSGADFVVGPDVN